MIDLDDLLDGIGSSRELGERGQRVARALFGLLLAALSAAGAWHIATGVEGGLPLRAAFVAMFVNLGLFGLIAIGLGRGVRGLGCLFAASFAAIFVVRILFGA